MQKVEGSSPFSRFKNPAKAGFFVGHGLVTDKLCPKIFPRSEADFAGAA